LKSHCFSLQKEVRQEFTSVLLQILNEVEFKTHMILSLQNVPDSQLVSTIHCLGQECFHTQQQMGRTSLYPLLLLLPEYSSTSACWRLRAGNEVNVTIGEQCKNRDASAGRNG